MSDERSAIQLAKKISSKPNVTSSRGSPFNQRSIQIQATGRPSATATQLVPSKVEETTLRASHVHIPAASASREDGGGAEDGGDGSTTGGEGSSDGRVAWLSTWPMKRGRAGEGGGHPRLFR
jgi:hypothetical protein